MNLTLEARDPCPQCGYESHWIKVGSFRVNKKSLRQTSPGILAHALQGGCPECGHHIRADTSPSRWWLRPDDEARVKNARAKRGWA